MSARDTAGCGDVFRGGYAEGLAFGVDLIQRLRFVSPAAALYASRSGEQRIPCREEARTFRETAVLIDPDLRIFLIRRLWLITPSLAGSDGGSRSESGRASGLTKSEHRKLGLHIFRILFWLHSQVRALLGRW